MRDTFLSFSPPSIGDDEIAEVVDTLRSDWITTGPKTGRFEQEFAARIGVDNVLAVNSCTAALHLALLACDIGPGDEVITTPMTFAASVNVIEHVGATPVLVDIDRSSMQIDASRIAAAIGERTRAVIPVHYTGHPADVDAIEQAVGARRDRVTIIEDAAHALPAAVDGRMIGTTGDFTAFSFYATKNLTTGEGGMLAGRDADRMARARKLSLHGMSRDAWRRYDPGGGWFYEVDEPGWKYNMTDIQASLGLHQLRRLDEFQARRRHVVARYNEAFGTNDKLETPKERPGYESAWHLYVLRLRLERLGIDRSEFVAELAKRNIATSVHFIPIHLHPFYRDKYGWSPESFPVAAAEYERIVSLPLHPRLSDDDVDDVIEAVFDVVDH